MQHKPFLHQSVKEMPLAILGKKKKKIAQHVTSLETSLKRVCWVGKVVLDQCKRVICS